MQNKMNCDWLHDMLVKHPLGLSLTNENCYVVQSFYHTSEGLAMRDYEKWNL